jgi:hypothetical protein
MSVSIAPFIPVADFLRLICLAGARATLRSTDSRTQGNYRPIARLGSGRVNDTRYRCALSVYTLVLLFLRCLALNARKLTTRTLEG